MLAEEENIINEALQNTYRNNALFQSALECRKMIKNIRQSEEAKQKIKTLGYIGESLNPHAIRRLTDESTIKEYELANENFISKIIDTSTKVIKSIIDAIVSAVKKIIEWISSLFGGGGGSNESKNKQVEKEIKDAKDKKESPKDEGKKNNNDSPVTHSPSPPPARTPTPSAGPGIQTLIEENKANIIPDENNPYINYYLFGHMFSKTSYVADPSTPLPYFITMSSFNWNTDDSIITNYVRVCKTLIDVAKTITAIAGNSEDISRMLKQMKESLNNQFGSGTILVTTYYNEDVENRTKNHDLKNITDFSAKTPAYEYFSDEFKSGNEKKYLITSPSLGLEFVGFNIKKLIEVLEPNSQIKSLPEKYRISHDGVRPDVYDEQCVKKFLQKHWNNDYSKLDDLIKNNYDEAQKIFEQSSSNIDKMLKYYNKLSKELPKQKDFEELYNGVKSSTHSTGIASAMCLSFVFDCLKQFSYEMRSVQKLSDAARSQGRYIANKKVQFNTEAAA